MTRQALTGLLALILVPIFVSSELKLVQVVSAAPRMFLLYVWMRPNPTAYFFIRFQLFRHGDRAPTAGYEKWYPTDPHINEDYAPAGLGGLTEVSVSPEGRNFFDPDRKIRCLFFHILRKVASVLISSVSCYDAGIFQSFRFPNTRVLFSVPVHRTSIDVDYPPKPRSRLCFQKPSLSQFIIARFSRTLSSWGSTFVQ